MTRGGNADDSDMYLYLNLLRLLGSNRIQRYMISNWMPMIWLLWMNWMKVLKVQVPGIRSTLISDEGISPLYSKQYMHLTYSTDTLP
jgi:hypothetical protein